MQNQNSEKKDSKDSAELPDNYSASDSQSVTQASNRVTPPPTLGYAIGSRTLDVLVSGIALLLASPLMLALAIMIRLDSPGPIFFRHVRVGLNRRRADDPNRTAEERRVENHFGQPFTLLKYRTMYQDARERFPARYAYLYDEDKLLNLPMKALQASESGAEASGDTEGDDPRLTRMGRWLRRTSLDELPNLINVLRGEMALVGPRPDIAENFKYYLPEHSTKFDVKPGVTGLAQVYGRGNLLFHETNAYDVEYICNRTLWLDIKILFRTVAVVLRREGAL